MDPSGSKKTKVETIRVCGITEGQPARAPWISRVFDAMGLVFIAVAIVLFLVSWFAAETKFYIALFVSLLISGLLYTAVGEILRSCAATAANTAKLVQLKEVEIAERMEH
ncbi:MAG: hypothetical protein IJU70_01320 [Lentisphaeria bacterium]|nr:hypothetical protein [Lentisphaeria bacterium]